MHPGQATDQAPRRIWSCLLREPLLHFLLAGAVIFGLYSFQSDPAAPARENRITVTSTDVEQLRAAWSKQWQRPPTAEEMQGLVAAHVHDEVLYREALAMGLDRGDPIIRRRLVQKFEFLTEDLAASRDPTKVELLAYYDANRERYRVPPRLSFTQIYFSPDRRGTIAARDAGMVLASLRAGSTEATALGLGDSTMLNDSYRRMAAQDIEAMFGRAFAEAMLKLELGVWSGPIASGYGLHLVRLDERIAGRVPALDEVLDQVRNDWAYDQRRQANETVFQSSLARYVVVIKGDAPDRASAATPDVEQEPGR